MFFTTLSPNLPVPMLSASTMTAGALASLTIPMGVASSRGTFLTPFPTAAPLNHPSVHQRRPSCHTVMNAGMRMVILDKLLGHKAL